MRYAFGDIVRGIDESADGKLLPTAAHGCFHQCASNIFPFSRIRDSLGVSTKNGREEGLYKVTRNPLSKN